MPWTACDRIAINIHQHSMHTINTIRACDPLNRARIGGSPVEFKGKTALVTGGGTGIGRTVASAFAERGAGVVLLGRRREPLEEAAADIRSRWGVPARVFAGVDVADGGAVDRVFAELEAAGEGVDYIINNAGVSGPVRCFVSTPLGEFRDAVAIHLTGSFWCAVRGLPSIRKGGKIITISTFFTEERPLEQRPYRFRSPYTAAQGAKNRLAEALSWELADRGIASIATNPGPVHSDRIYKTVYPKAALEFLRAAGFEGVDPAGVAGAGAELLPLLGESDGTVRDGIAAASGRLGIGEDVLTRMLEKISTIAEKVQSNTSRMIQDGQFLTQAQVAETVLCICGDGISAILNGRVVPGDRVSYPVRAHVGAAAPPVPPQRFGTVLVTADAVDGAGASLAEHLSGHVSGNGGRAVCAVSGSASADIRDRLAGSVGAEAVDLADEGAVDALLGRASGGGRIQAAVHITGGPPERPLSETGRDEWDALVARLVTTPATIAQRALEAQVPGGGADPRLYRDARGAVLIVGPGLPVGKKTAGAQRARAEVFRGALRPFTATVNQELSEVLGSRARVFTVLPGTVSGAEPDDSRVAAALDFAVSDDAPSSPVVTFCVDESR